MSETADPLGRRGRNPGTLQGTRPCAEGAVMREPASAACHRGPRRQHPGIPVAQEHGVPQGLTAGLCASSSAGLVGMQSGEGPGPDGQGWQWTSGGSRAAQGPGGRGGEGHCVTGKRNRWAGY